MLSDDSSSDSDSCSARIITEVVCEDVDGTIRVLDASSGKEEAQEAQLDGGESPVKLTCSKATTNSTKRRISSVKKPKRCSNRTKRRHSSSETHDGRKRSRKGSENSKWLPVSVTLKQSEDPEKRDDGPDCSSDQSVNSRNCHEKSPKLTDYSKSVAVKAVQRLINAQKSRINVIESSNISQKVSTYLIEKHRPEIPESSAPASSDTVNLSENAVPKNAVKRPVNAVLPIYHGAIYPNLPPLQMSPLINPRIPPSMPPLISPQDITSVVKPNTVTPPLRVPRESLHIPTLPPLQKARAEPYSSIAEAKHYFKSFHSTDLLPTESSLKVRDPLITDTTIPNTALSGTSLIGTSIPGTSMPDTYIPDTYIPDSSILDTSIPETSVPKTLVPETSIFATPLPVISLPGTTVPSTSMPGTSVPDTSMPGTSVPDISMPGTSVPDTSMPGTSIPDTSMPGTSVPDISMPGTSVPDTSMPGTSVPDTSMPGTSTPQIEGELDDNRSIGHAGQPTSLDDINQGQLQTFYMTLYNFIQKNKDENNHVIDKQLVHNMISYGNEQLKKLSSTTIRCISANDKNMSNEHPTSGNTATSISSCQSVQQVLNVSIQKSPCKPTVKAFPKNDLSDKLVSKTEASLDSVGELRGQFQSKSAENVALNISSCENNQEINTQLHVSSAQSDAKRLSLTKDLNIGTFIHHEPTIKQLLQYRFDQSERASHQSVFNESTKNFLRGGSAVDSVLYKASITQKIEIKSSDNLAMTTSSQIVPETAKLHGRHEISDSFPATNKLNRIRSNRGLIESNNSLSIKNKMIAADSVESEQQEIKNKIENPCSDLTSKPDVILVDQKIALLDTTKQDPLLRGNLNVRILNKFTARNTESAKPEENQCSKNAETQNVYHKSIRTSPSPSEYTTMKNSENVQNNSTKIQPESSDLTAIQTAKIDSTMLCGDAYSCVGDKTSQTATSNTTECRNDGISDNNTIHSGREISSKTGEDLTVIQSSAIFNQDDSSTDFIEGMLCVNEEMKSAAVLTEPEVSSLLKELKSEIEDKIKIDHQENVVTIDGQIQQQQIPEQIPENTIILPAPEELVKLYDAEEVLPPLTQLFETASQGTAILSHITKTKSKKNNRIQIRNDKTCTLSTSRKQKKTLGKRVSKKNPHQSQMVENSISVKIKEMVSSSNTSSGESPTNQTIFDKVNARRINNDAALPASGKSVNSTKPKMTQSSGSDSSALVTSSQHANACLLSNVQEIVLNDASGKQQSTSTSGRQQSTSPEVLFAVNSLDQNNQSTIDIQQSFNYPARQPSAAQFPGNIVTFPTELIAHNKTVIQSNTTPLSRNEIYMDISYRQDERTKGCFSDSKRKTKTNVKTFTIFDKYSSLFDSDDEEKHHIASTDSCEDISLDVVQRTVAHSNTSVTQTADSSQSLVTTNAISSAENFLTCIEELPVSSCTESSLRQNLYPGSKLSKNIDNIKTEDAENVQNSPVESDVIATDVLTPSVASSSDLNRIARKEYSSTPRVLHIKSAPLTTPASISSSPSPSPTSSTNLKDSLLNQNPYCPAMSPSTSTWMQSPPTPLTPPTYFTFNSPRTPPTPDSLSSSRTPPTPDTLSSHGSPAIPDTLSSHGTSPIPDTLISHGAPPIPYALSSSITPLTTPSGLSEKQTHPLSTDTSGNCSYDTRTDAALEPDTKTQTNYTFICSQDLSLDIDNASSPDLSVSCASIQPTGYCHPTDTKKPMLAMKAKIRATDAIEPTDVDISAESTHSTETIQPTSQYRRVVLSDGASTVMDTNEQTKALHQESDKSVDIVQLHESINPTESRLTKLPNKSLVKLLSAANLIQMLSLEQVMSSASVRCDSEQAVRAATMRISYNENLLRNLLLATLFYGFLSSGATAAENSNKVSTSEPVYI